jgi:hypothetical protein
MSEKRGDSLINKLYLKNFRGIEEADVELAPITILTGANNSGKSTLMYGLLALKNVVSNPNQPLDSFFNFTFMNLGGFKESVYLKQDDARRIEIRIESSRGNARGSYGVLLGKTQSRLTAIVEKPFPLTLPVDVTFPYALNASAGASVARGDFAVKVTWNGLTGTIATEPVSASNASAPTTADSGVGAAPVTAASGAPVAGAAAGATGMEAKQISRDLASALNGPLVDIRGVDFVPLKRGFTKPIFSPVPLQAQLLTEDEIATFVANDRDLEASVNFYLEKIVDKNFQVRPTLGTANFYLQTTDRKTGFLCDLVNDGFGTNELVYLLTKALRKEQTFICIEEPEIHIHPGALIKLMKVLLEIAREHGKRFLISTHSEHLVVELLNSVANKAVSPEDVRIYFLQRDRARTVIEPQQVTEKGQIEGGLKGFYEAELEQIRDFIRVPQER